MRACEAKPTCQSLFFPPFQPGLVDHPAQDYIQGFFQSFLVTHLIDVILLSLYLFSRISTQKLNIGTSFFYFLIFEEKQFDQAVENKEILAVSNLVDIIIKVATRLASTKDYNR